MSPTQKKSEDGTENNDLPIDVSVGNDDPQTIVKNLYEKNIEIVNKNKTLSLLGKLYEISILALKPQDLAVRVSQTVQIDLSFELVGIFVFESESDSLIPLAFSKSERLTTTLEKLGLSPEELRIPGISSRNFFKNTVVSKRENETDDLEEVWGGLIEPAKLQAIVSEDHIKTTLLYPLVTESKVLGAVILALNRTYEALITPNTKHPTPSYAA
jgi:hypothetical protein